MNETDMVTSAPPRRRRTLKMGLWLLLVAVTLLGALAVNAGVSGPGAQEPGLLMALLGRATPLPPTPTKTPTVAPEFTATPTPPTPLPTDTPLPTATPTAAPVTTAAAAPGVTDELATLVRSYGYDPGGRFIVVDQDLQQMIVAERGAIPCSRSVQATLKNRRAHRPGTATWACTGALSHRLGCLRTKAGSSSAATARS